MRRADPAVIESRKRQHPNCSFEANPGVMFMKDNFGQEAYDKMLQGIRDVFDVHAIDERGGLTEMETLNLFQSYGNFLGTLKKSISLRPIVSPTSASAQSVSAMPPSMACA